MKNLDSDDILYMTDAPPPPSLAPLPPTLHAFLDSPGASLHVLEMDIHAEDETFLGIPIPCIVVTSEGEALPVQVLAMQLSRLSSPSQDLLAPPPTTYRGRMETDHPSVIVDDHGARSSPCKEEDRGESPSLLCDGSEYLSTTDVNFSWEVISGDMVNSNSTSSSIQCLKPDRPMAPKPAPLLRRRERSLLRRMLGGGGHISALAAEKVKSKRLTKEVIGPPRPLSPVSQPVTVP